MRNVAIISATLVFSFALSGCYGGPAVPDPVTIYECAMEPFNTKDLKQLHLVVDRIELHHVGIAGQEYTYARDVDLDVDVAGATDGWSAFAGEYDIPRGDYNGFTVHFGESYGVRANGDTVPVGLTHETVKVDQAFSTHSEKELRVVFCIYGELERTTGRDILPPLYTYDNSFQGIRFTYVDDATSGSDVHEIGELVRLPEAFN